MRQTVRSMSRIGRKPVLIPESVQVTEVDYDPDWLHPIKKPSPYTLQRMIENLPTKESFQAFGTPKRAKVEGPLGAIHVPLHSYLRMAVGAGSVSVRPECDGATKLGRTLWGTTRALLANAVRGVSQGYRKDLELHGIGFKAAVQKGDDGRDTVTMRLGYANEIVYVVPHGVTVSAPTQTTLVVYGAHKMHVGNVAAALRRFREPDAYKGKGVRYAGEVLRLKQGKRMK